MGVWSARKLLMAASVIAIAPCAHAQTEEEDEIVVTARLRAETVQDAPVSVNVATEEALDRIGATSLLDLPRAAPGVILQKAPNSSQTGVTVRGLGSSPGAASFESSVGLFVNGAYVPRTREFAASLYDIDRVEVVRGTQSSLLGKNTSLGAINVVTRAPGDEFTADAMVTREFELESWTASGGLSVPLTDALSVRLAGQHEDLGGWVYNTAADEDSEAIERDAARLTVAWTPVANFDATAMVETQDYTGTGMPAEFIRVGPAAGGLSALAGHPVDANFDRENASSDSRIDGGGDFREDSSVDRASLTLHWRLGDHEFTSQTAWTQSESSALAGADFLPGDYFLQDTDLNADSWSQEIRLTSPENRFRYVVGAWFGANTFDQFQTYTANYPDPDGPGPIPPLVGQFTTHFDQSTDTWSIFGQADYDLTDRLTLSAGVRYTDEQKDVDISRVEPFLGGGGTLAGGLGQPFPLYAAFSRSRSEAVTDGLLNLSYDATEDLMFYVSWAQGTKSGGFADSATFLDQSEYEAEVAQTIEAGIRFESNDRRWTANATLYATEVSDYQLVTFTGTSFLIDNTNLEARGIESEVYWRPDFAPGLTLSWRNTYNDAEDADTGAEIPRAPLWSGGLVAAYDLPLGAGWTLNLDGSVDYESAQTHQQDPNAVPRADAITLYGAGIGVENENGLSIRLVGRNLTDENRYTFVFPTPFLGDGSANAISERPRTIALQASYRY